MWPFSFVMFFICLRPVSLISQFPQRAQIWENYKGLKWYPPLPPLLLHLATLLFLLLYSVLRRFFLFTILYYVCYFPNIFVRFSWHSFDQQCQECWLYFPVNIFEWFWKNRYNMQWNSCLSLTKSFKIRMSFLPLIKKKRNELQLSQY